MASANFRNVALAIASASINFGTDSFKALLVTSFPNEAALDTWQNRADVTGEHAASGGYVAGGFNVTVSSMTLNTTDNRLEITFSAPDPTYENVTLSGVVGCIIYKSTGNAANDLLVSAVDFGSAKGVTGGNFRVTFSTPLLINV